MKSIVKFELTEKQTEILQRHFESNAAEIGMILGQFFDTKDGKAFVEVGYLNNKKALKLQEAMGLKPGKKTPKISHGVYVEL